MTTPTSTISMSDVNTELGKSSSALITLNDTDVRNLAGVPSGAISMNDLRGKSAVNYGTLTPNFTTRAEGQSFTFTLSGGTAVPNGTYYWRVDYISNLTAADFSSAVSGTFTVTNNVGSFTVTTLNDTLDEGDGTFRVVVGDVDQVPVAYVTSPECTVTETVTYTAGTIANANPYRYGAIVTHRTVAFQVDTTNLPAGTTLYWNIQNVTGTITTDDLPTLTGSASTGADGAAGVGVVINEVADGSAVPSKSFRFRVYKDSARTQLVATSSTVTIRAAPTYSLSFSPATIAEGGATSLTISTTNFPPATSLYYTVTGATSDLLGAPTSGSMGLSSGATANSALTITLRIASIAAYGAARTFSVQYSLNGRAWTSTGLSASSITVNANATSSSTVTIYSTPGGALVTSLKCRVSLTGHTTKESNTISGFYM